MKLESAKYPVGKRVSCLSSLFNQLYFLLYFVIFFRVRQSDSNGQTVAFFS